MSMRSNKRSIRRMIQRIPTYPADDAELMTRDEFELQYPAAPELQKAELIEGRACLQPPEEAREHADLQSRLSAWLNAYAVGTEGVEHIAGRRVRLDRHNEPQPDGLLRIYPSRGGQTRTGQDGWIEGPPELITEISASSAGHPLHGKLEAYRRNGVREYVIWIAFEAEILWFRLDREQYVPVRRDASGLYKSEVFPGLWLDPEWLIDGEVTKALRTLRQGLSTLEHAAFVARLANAAIR